MIDPLVNIRKLEGYDLPALEEAVASFLQSVKLPALNRAKRVLLKPNTLGAYPPQKAVTTHPAVLEALIRYLLSKNKEVWIGDSPGGTVNVEKVWETCGYKDLAERYPVKLVNLSTAGFRELEYLGTKVKVSEVFWKCGAVINVAKYKTHSLMAYTGAVKNLYGLVPGMVKSEYHRLYPDTQSFAGLLAALYACTRNRITYSILDGIWGMDGAGPSGGNRKDWGLLFGSTSPSALDCVASRLLGFKISDVPYLEQVLHQDGVLPRRIKIPTSFRQFRIMDADIRSAKLSKETLKYVPGVLKTALRKLYYYHPEVSDRCRRCGICVKSCPVKAIDWEPQHNPAVDPTRCIKCMCCHELCPHQAIDIHKSWVAKRILR